MAMNTTRWSPDTCACVVDYEWDEASSEDNRVHTHVRSVVVCPDHAGMAVNGPHQVVDDLVGPAHCAQIKRESQSKNMMKGHLLADPMFARHRRPASFVGPVPLKRQPDGSVVVDLPADHPDELIIHYDEWWSFTGQGAGRRLQIAHPTGDLNVAEKAVLRARASTMPITTAVK